VTGVQTCALPIYKAKHISNYGDIPSVRKAIDLINTDCKLKNKLSVIMSSRCKKQLERKKRINQKYVGGLNVEHGVFTISFD